MRRSLGSSKLHDATHPGAAEEWRWSTNPTPGTPRPACCAATTAASRCASTAAASRGSGATSATSLSKGYTCEKALRIDHYQNNTSRLTSPLRRTEDGGYEEIDWDTAIAEVAAGLQRVVDEHGGDRILYYGGGGQGNHLCGAYGAATRKALGITRRSNALAQEKTGEAWVEGHLFGTHTHGEFDQAEVAVFLGKNPWHSHGFDEARRVLKEIANDPGRSMVVMDPRRTETADLADALPAGAARHRRVLRRRTRRRPRRGGPGCHEAGSPSTPSGPTWWWRP